jgi:hypothetical protein
MILQPNRFLYPPHSLPPPPNEFYNPSAAFALFLPDLTSNVVVAAKIRANPRITAETMP